MKRIAISINEENEQICEHFGHAPRFKLYDIEDGKVVSSTYLDTPYDHGPDKLQAMLDNKVDVIISNGMGPGIYQKAPLLHIEIIAGQMGDADSVLKQYLNGELKNDMSAVHSCGHC